MLYGLLLVVALALPTAHAAVNTKKFDDTFSRDVILPLIASPNSEDPQQCLSKALPGSSLVHTYSVDCDYFSDSCVGLVAVSPNDQAIIISYRGTQGALQFIAEIQETAFKSQVHFISGGKVSLYFNDAFYDLWEGGIRDAFLKVAKENPTYQLWIVGHSLGGSIGALTGSYISSQGLFPAEQIRLITFGQPRTGDKKFADAHDHLVPYSFRLTHNKDLVPHTPPEFSGFYHHSTEIFYPNDMSPNPIFFKTCGGGEDFKCSDGHLDFSLKDHIHYFGQDITAFGKAGCQ